VCVFNNPYTNDAGGSVWGLRQEIFFVAARFDDQGWEECDDMCSLGYRRFCRLSLSEHLETELEEVGIERK